MECFATQNLWPLHGRTLVLSLTAKSRTFAITEPGFSILVFFGSLLAFGIRGAQYQHKLYGDDKELVAHVLSRKPPYGLFGSLDRLGIFDPFNNYLAVILRIYTRIALIGPDSGFTFRVFLISTLTWSLSVLAIAKIIKSQLSAQSGLIAVFVCCLLPFSNQALLAQVNSVVLPFTILAIVVVALQAYPLTPKHRFWFALLFSMLTLSEGTMIVAIGLMALNIVKDRKKVIRFELLLLMISAGSFAIQWLTYRTRLNHRDPFMHELYRMLFGVAPQFLRSQAKQHLSLMESTILWIIPVILLSSWLVLAVYSQKKKSPLVFPATTLLLSSLGLPVLLIIANGWLNTHYLFMPTAIFWISVIFLAHSTRTIHALPAKISKMLLAFCFIVSISGTYYVS